MEHLKCNQLACRNVLRDKAVVTTCSHAFCLPCANGLFGNTRVCPACASSLPEPDDIVVCSLQPTNDYKTSVLSGLSPGIILQICERAVTFWEYQARQENAFQQAILKTVNDKGAHLQKQLDSLLREANSELGILNDKVNGLERELELERRKNREHQEQLREKDKEYAKLKRQYEHLKRKTLLAPGAMSAAAGGNANQNFDQDGMRQDERILSSAGTTTAGLAGFGNLSNTLDDVVNSMDSGGIQRTPLRGFANGAPAWQPQQQQNMSNTNPGQGNGPVRNRFQSYPPGGRPPNERVGMSANGARHFRRDSEGNTSDSTDQVEGILGLHGRQDHRVPLNQSAAGSSLQATSSLNRHVQRGFSFGQTTPRGVPEQSSEQCRPGTFRPGGVPR